MITTFVAAAVAATANFQPAPPVNSQARPMMMQPGQPMMQPGQPMMRDGQCECCRRMGDMRQMMPQRPRR